MIFFSVRQKIGLLVAERQSIGLDDTLPVQIDLELSCTMEQAIPKGSVAYNDETQMSRDDLRRQGDTID